MPSNERFSEWRGFGTNVNQSPRVRLGGGAACYNRDTSSLDRFQAQPIWEMSGNVLQPRFPLTCDFFVGGQNNISELAAHCAKRDLS